MPQATRNFVQLVPIRAEVGEVNSFVKNFRSIPFGDICLQVPRQTQEARFRGSRVLASGRLLCKGRDYAIY